MEGLRDVERKYGVVGLIGHDQVLFPHIEGNATYVLEAEPVPCSLEAPNSSVGQL